MIWQKMICNQFICLINLFSFHNEQLKYADRIFYIRLGIVAVIVGIFIACWLYYDNNIVDYDSMTNIKKQVKYCFFISIQYLECLFQMIIFKWLSLWMYNLKMMMAKHHGAKGMIVFVYWLLVNCVSMLLFMYIQ